MSAPCLTWPVLWLAALLGLVAPAAHGAPEAPSALQVFVFGATHGAPLVGATLEVKGVRATANADGTARFTPGAGTHAVIVTPPAGAGFAGAEVPAVPVVPGELTEVLITLVADGAPRVAIESRTLDPTGVVAEVEAVAGPMGQVQGRAVRADGDRPVAGARVFVRGRSDSDTTGPDGRFTLQLPVGPHLLSVIHPDFSPGTAEVQVVADTPAAPVIALAPAALQLDAFVVEAPYLQGGVAQLTAERRSTSGVVDVIGAEQMARTGDSSAAGALRRVTGLTLVGGKYVYVRGMGERYASTTLNGTRLPSPEPERRVVPLDLFPTGILGSVVVQKSWSPDQPGAFGGGVVQLRTRGAPEAPFVQVSASTGFRPDTTFQEGLAGPGGAYDWLGVDDGSRSLPSPVADILKGRLLSRSQDDFKALGKSFPRTWNTHTRTAPPPLKLAVAAGRPVEIAGHTLGVLGAVSYGQTWLKRSVTRRNTQVRTANGEIVVEGQAPMTIDRLGRTVQGSGLLELDLTLAPDQRVWSTTLVLRSTDDITRLRTGFDEDQMTDVRVHRVEWVERMLIDQVLRGHHGVGLGAIDWAYALSRASRDEPDRRSYRYDREPANPETGDPGGYRMYDRPEGNQRFFSDMADIGHDVRVGWTVPLGEARRADAPDEALHQVQVGARWTARSRDSRTYRFRFLDRLGELGVDADLRRQVRGADPDTTLGADSLDNGWFELRDNTQPTDSYTGEEAITAGYAQGEVSLPGDVRIMAGARVEHGRVTVLTQRPFAINAEAIKASPSATDVLPAATVTWGLREGMQLRGGFARTVTRPDFHELSPAQKDPVDGDRPVKGNPDLRSGSIDHYDVRWEWYPSPRESVSVAGFYKGFDAPIETTINAGADGARSFRNSRGAHNLGLELDARWQLEPLGAWAEQLYVAGNLALISSEVDLSGDSVVTSKQRPLEGQSPYVLNVQLGYEDLDAGHHLTVLYNVFGRRVVEVGSKGQPDVYEEPRHMLDVVAGVDLGRGMRLNLRAANLLDLPITATAGPVVNSRYRAGRAFSAGLVWRL